MTGPRHPGSGFVATTARAITGRMHETNFWLIQGSVILISAIHIGFEAEGLPLGIWATTPGAHHVPVILYLAPVALAALAYGWEGGVLTGLWTAALASINMIIWHRANFEWTLELTLVSVVVGMGVAMSLPVERERRQRQRAEAASGRLKILNDLSAATTSIRTPPDMAAATLERIIDLLRVRSVGVCLWFGDKTEPVVADCRGEGLAIAANPLVRGVPPTWQSLIEGNMSSRVIGTRIATGNIMGFLAVATVDDNSQLPGFSEFLATAGQQLAVRIENAIMSESERATMATYVRLVTQAQEEERRRLARDLHDGPAQRLADLVRRLQPGESMAVATLGDLHGSASEILRELRRVARDQRPTLLDDLGLAPALDWLVSELRTEFDIEVDVFVTGDTRRLDPDTEVAFYRVAQEALNNSAHHSHASSLRVEICFGERELELAVIDDGIGFEVPKSQSGFIHEGGLGVMGMYERADLISGRLEVISQSGHGTVVRLSAKIPPS